MKKSYEQPEVQIVRVEVEAAVLSQSVEFNGMDYDERNDGYREI